MLEFLGRTDAQVKVRGFRIEPGEVEAALREHPAVREAVVAAREDAAGGRGLVGYVVLGGEGPSAAELREHLGARLPEHLVPGAFVFFPSLPLTPTGKVDRRALPAPEDGGTDAQAAPRTPAEEVLAGIWADVLGRERVGAGEDFFALGGHSLLATRVVSRVREVFGVELPLRALFEASTVERLGARVEAARRGEGAARPAQPPLERLPGGAEAPLSFAQQRLWFLDRLVPGSAAYHMPFALGLRGALEVRALGRGLDALAERHESLRTVLAEAEGGPVQRVLPRAPVPLPYVDLGGMEPQGRGREARRLGREAARRPFDLERGPLWRAVLLRLEAQEHALLCTLHHAISDGWSMRGAGARALGALWGAHAGGGGAPGGAGGAVRRVRGVAAGVALGRGAGAGAGLVEGAPGGRAGAAGAADGPAASGGGGRGGASVAVALPEEVGAGLRALGRREGATGFMVLLAGWQALLGRYTGAEEVVVGTPVSGRSRVELEGVVGLFVNTLAVRTGVAGSARWGSCSRR